MDLKLTVRGEAELSAKLNRVISRLGSLEVEFVELGRVLTSFFSTQPFLSRGGVYGEGWAPLSPAYAAIKERKYPGKGTLVASGAMMNSFSAEVEPMRLTIVNTSDLFAYHQQGTEKMPQRIMMQLDQQRLNLVKQTVKQSLDMHIAEAWA